jgi:hypothetical protein
MWLRNSLTPPGCRVIIALYRRASRGGAARSYRPVASGIPFLGRPPRDVTTGDSFDDVHAGVGAEGRAGRRLLRAVIARGSSTFRS